jgi:hypothetical protein
VTIGDEELSTGGTPLDRESQDAVRVAARTVDAGGPERLQSCARFLERTPSGSKTGRELLFSALDVGEDEDDRSEGAVLSGEFGDL